MSIFVRLRLYPASTNLTGNSLSIYSAWVFQFLFLIFLKSVCFVSLCYCFHGLAQCTFGVGLSMGAILGVITYLLMMLLRELIMLIYTKNPLVIKIGMILLLCALFN